MPLLHSDPLSDPTIGLELDVNPYVARLMASAQNGELPVAFGPVLADRRGKWSASIGHSAEGVAPPRPLILEIGCHKGRVVVPLAHDHPEWSVIGCDITFKRVILTAESIKKAELNNACAIYANAKGLDKVFAPSELSGVVIFFPDPWSKKARQTHKRLLNSDFVARLMPLLRDDAFVWLKTDCRAYRDDTCALLDRDMRRLSGFEELGLCDYPSSYEKKFQAQNVPTYSDIWVKSQGSH